MKTWLMIMGFLYGAGFMAFEHMYEAGILCCIFAVLCGIWNSIDKAIWNRGSLLPRKSKEEK